MSTNDESTASANADKPAVLIATEEHLAVTAHERETGALRVRTVSHKELQDVPVLLRSTTAQVERVVISRFVDAEFAPRYEGDTLIVPVFEYVPVTELKLMLKEEIRITTIVSEKEDVHTAEVQRQEVVVERRVGIAGDWIAEPAMPSSGAGESASKPAV